MTCFEKNCIVSEAAAVLLIGSKYNRELKFVVVESTSSSSQEDVARYHREIDFELIFSTQEVEL